MADLGGVGYCAASVPGSVLTFATAALCFVAAMYAFARANAVASEIVRAINQQGPSDDQEAPYVWYPSRWERVTAKYKALFPEGKLLKKFWAYTASGAIWMLCALISLVSGGL